MHQCWVGRIMKLVPYFSRYSLIQSSNTQPARASPAPLWVAQKKEESAIHYFLMSRLCLPCWTQFHCVERRVHCNQQPSNSNQFSVASFIIVFSSYGDSSSCTKLRISWHGEFHGSFHSKKLLQYLPIHTRRFALFTFSKQAQHISATKGRADLQQPCHNEDRNHYNPKFSLTETCHLILIGFLDMSMKFLEIKTLICSTHAIQSTKFFAWSKVNSRLLYIAGLTCNLRLMHEV